MSKHRHDAGALCNALNTPVLKVKQKLLARETDHDCVTEIQKKIQFVIQIFRFLTREGIYKWE